MEGSKKLHSVHMGLCWARELVLCALVPASHQNLCFTVYESTSPTIKQLSMRCLLPQHTGNLRQSFGTTNFEGKQKLQNKKVKRQAEQGSW